MIRFYKLTSNNKELLEVAGSGTCIYCSQYVFTYEVIKYTDKGQTAICPKCGVDALIPSVSGNLLSVLSDKYCYKEGLEK